MKNINKTNWTNNPKHPRRPTTEGSKQIAVTHIAQATNAYVSAPVCSPVRDFLLIFFIFQNKDRMSKYEGDRYPDMGPEAFPITEGNQC